MKTFTAYRPDVASHGKHTSDQMNAPDAPQYEGVVFTDGTCALRWMTAKKSTSVWASLSDMLDIHGHAEYGTYIVWGDGRVQNYIGNGQFEDRNQ
jgi:hypothetical protein